MPSYDTLKKVMYRKRNKALQTNKVQFTKVKDIKVPGIFNSFLLADYKEKNTRLYLFVTPKAKNSLKSAKHFFVDGTFKCATPPFPQLYTVHADLGSTKEKNSILPVAYALLSSKK